jgi:hypothetical protein
MAPQSAPRKSRKADKQKGKAKEALLFVNKKKQKDFFTLGLGRWRDHRPWPRLKEVFCAAFFQKSGCLLTSA